jgi:hypothetical protein
MGFCRKLPGGTGIGHYRPNQCFHEGWFDVSIQSLTFQKGIKSDECSEGLGFHPFYVQSPCNPLIKDYTEILYTIYKWDVPSIQCKKRLGRCPLLILLDFIILIILGEEYKLCSSSLCSFLHPPVTLSLFGPNILLNTLFSNTVPYCQRPCFTPIQNHWQNSSLDILKFTFFDSIHEDRRFWTEW